VLVWTTAVVVAVGLVAAYPMLAFWHDSFFHILEAQWGRADRLELEQLPLMARFWFFAAPESGFHPILVLSLVPVFELVHTTLRNRRAGVAAAPESDALAFLLAMAVLSYLPLLVFKLGYVQYFVNASLLLSLAIGISIPIVARRSKRNRVVLSLAFAVAWLWSLGVSLVHLDKWVSTEQPTIVQLEPVRREIEALTPDGCTMLTFDTPLAVETGCDVTPGLEYSYFSFFPVMSSARAREHGVLNRQLLQDRLRIDRPEYVALTREDAKRIMGREFAGDQDPVLPPMVGRYRLLRTLRLPVGPFYRFWDEIYLYVRTDL